MRGNTFLGHLVHLFGADLDLELHSALDHHRGVQRLVEVRQRHRDEVLDAARHRAPQRVDRAERGVTVLHGFGDDADREQVIDLFDRNALAL